MVGGNKGGGLCQGIGVKIWWCSGKVFGLRTGQASMVPLSQLSDHDPGNVNAAGQALGLSWLG